VVDRTRPHAGIQYDCLVNGGPVQ